MCFRLWQFEYVYVVEGRDGWKKAEITALRGSGLLILADAGDPGSETFHSSPIIKKNKRSNKLCSQKLS